MDRILFYILWTGLCLVVPAKFQTTVAIHNINNNITKSKLNITSNLTFPYTVIDMMMATLDFNYTFEEETNQEGWVIVAFLPNDKFAAIFGDKEFHVPASNISGTVSVSVKGKLPGRTMLFFKGRDEVNDSRAAGAKVAGFRSDVEKYGQYSFELYVERQERMIDVAFNVIVVVLVVLANVGMGAKVDLSVVKAQLRRPFAPIIGLFSQFVFMPLIAFTVVCILDLEPGIGLGLLALGCSPGGSASNAYTYLLEGSVSLSITMTLISTIASLGFLPMWLFTLGRVVYSDARVRIPFETIFFSLLGIIIPVFVGIFLQRKFPKVAIWFINAVKYIMIVFILFILTVGVYANLYIFSLITGKVLLASALLPYIGFILGGLAAFICRQDMTSIITIAVETGIQNTGVPIVLLRMSLQGPDKDTSIVSPVASAIFTPIPLVLGIIFVQLRKLARAGQNLSIVAEKKTGKDSSKVSLKDPDDTPFETQLKESDNNLFEVPLKEPEETHVKEPEETQLKELDENQFSSSSIL